jgi:hypothetical protein
MHSNKPWIHTVEPVSGAYTVDFAQNINTGVCVTNKEAQVTLAGVGRNSPGEWTLYLLRQVYDTEPNNPLSPAQIVSISMQAGTDKGRGDLLGLNYGTRSPGGDVQTGNTLYRGMCVHITAGMVDCSISYLPLTRLSDDRLLAWVSPGRPQPQYIEGTATTAPTSDALALAQRMRLPAFSRRLRVWMTTEAVAVAVHPAVWFYSGPTFVARAYLPVPAAFQTIESSFLVPQEATHFVFADLAGPPGGTFVRFQWEMLS